MAVATSCPQLAVPFDGNVAALPRYSFPFGAAYAPVPYLTCTRGQQVFVVSVPHGTIGGRRWRRRPRAETLCVLLLERPDRHVHNGQTSLAPARFFWLQSDSRFRRAPLCGLTDNMWSLGLTYYSTHRAHNCILSVHTLRDWTFKCPRELAPWRSGYDVHHRGDAHYDNSLCELEVWPGPGAGGHRALSWRAGGLAAQRRRRAAEGD